MDICGKKLDLEAHVVNADIPMLLSSDVIKGLGMSVDFQKDSVEVHGKRFDLETASSGHYVVPLTGPQQPSMPSQLDTFISSLKTSLQRDDVTDDLLTYAQWKCTSEEKRETYAESVHKYDIDQDQYKWLTSTKQIPVRDEFYEEYEDTWPPDHYYSPDPMCFM